MQLLPPCVAPTCSVHHPPCFISTAWATSVPPPHPAGVREVSADHAASHVGKAEGVVILLRAAAYHRLKRSVLLPMDIVTRVRNS